MTAAWRACWNCRRPPGCAATACARYGRVTQDGARPPARRRHGRRRALRADRGHARPRAGRQCLAHDRHPRRQEPRGAQSSARRSGLQVNRLIRVAFGPFELGELDDGEVKEIEIAGAAHRTRREDRGARPSADFDAPLIDHDALPRHPEVRAKRASKGPQASSRSRAKSRGLHPSRRDKAAHLRMTGQKWSAVAIARNSRAATVAAGRGRSTRDSA